MVGEYIHNNLYRISSSVPGYTNGPDWEFNTEVRRCHPADFAGFKIYYNFDNDRDMYKEEISLDVLRAFLDNPVSVDEASL